MRAASPTRTSLLLAVLFLARSAGASPIDYDALEQLFGEPVTTSATGSPQRESDVAATMIIITAEDIHRSGARDIPGVLKSVPGVNVLQTSNDHSDVAVRGYNQAFSPRLLVLVDGRQVYADYYGFTPWSTVPVELADIRQIEIVKGPNSALFGFNAVGGVVNIVTYDPVDDGVNVVSLSGGTQDLVQGSAVASWKVGESAGIRFSASHRDSDDFSTPLPPDEAGTRRGNGRNALRLNAAVDLTADVRLGLEATWSDAAQAEFSPLYEMSYGDYETNSIKGYVAADTRLGLLQGSVYTNKIDADSYLGSTSVPFMVFDNRVTVAQLQSISRFAQRHTVRLSLEHRENSMHTTPVPGGEVSYDIDAVGGMWEWQLDPSLTLTSAVRIDHWSLDRIGSVPPGYGLANEDWDRSEAETSLNMGLVWQMTDLDTLRLTAGRGVLLPNLINLGGLVLPIEPVGYASGVPDLEPTIVDSYELSWDRTLSRIAARLRISAFHGHSEDIVTIAGGPRPADGLFGTPVNVGDSETRGLELSLDGTVADEWRWGVSYRYQEIEDAFDPAFPVQATLTEFEHTTPRHVAKANLGWQRGPWTIDGYLHYQSDFHGIVSSAFIAQLVPVSAYTAVDGRAGFALNDHVSLAVNGRNLTDAEQQQTSAPDVERAVFATVTIDFGSQ